MQERASVLTGLHLMTQPHNELLNKAGLTSASALDCGGTHDGPAFVSRAKPSDAQHRLVQGPQRPSLLEGTLFPDTLGNTGPKTQGPPFGLSSTGSFQVWWPLVAEPGKGVGSHTEMNLGSVQVHPTSCQMGTWGGSSSQSSHPELKPGFPRRSHRAEFPCDCQPVTWFFHNFSQTCIPRLLLTCLLIFFKFESFFPFEYFKSFIPDE
jgi:hypothetical protein